MKDLKIGIISQARLGSTRLPKKTLMKINGETLLGMHLKKLKQTGFNVILATTSEKGIEELLAVADELNVPYKIGSLDDVLSRYYLCAKEYELDVVVRVTSDCPLISPELIKEAVDEYLNFLARENVYFSNTLDRAYPRGMDFEIFSFDLLKLAYLDCLDMKYREHVTPYLYRDEVGFIEKIAFKHENFNADRSSWRLTVDVEDDFKLIKELCEKYHCDQMTYSELESFLDRNQNLQQINAHIEQKKV